MPRAYFAFSIHRVIMMPMGEEVQMESKAAFNWCFIGAGTLANIVAKAILPSGRHRIATVYTRRPQKCREFAGKCGAAACDSAEAAISTPDVDGVYIATPHTSHYEYARLALSLGKPVLCEKPITVSAPEAAELFALAAEKGVYLAEAMWTWFSPVAQKVRQWYEAGEFGTLYHAEARYHIDSQRYAARCTDPDLAGGALLDVGIYPITYLYRLFGKPAEIRCIGRLEGGIDLCEEVTMSFLNGLTCTASVSMCDFRGLEKVRLEGSKGRVRYYFFHNANRVKLVRRGGRNEVFKANGGYLNEFDVAAGEIRRGLTQSLLVPPGATTDVMEILDECRRQMKLVYPFENAAI